MFRSITGKDWELYRHYVDLFYHTDAVNAPVPEENYRTTFDELMRSDTYVKGYIFEYEGTPCGFALLSKTFSQEAGGISVTIEEIYIDPEYRSKGLATEFFEWLKSESGAMRLRLEVEDYNVGAKRLYERMGFELLPYLQMVIDQQRQKRSSPSGNGDSPLRDERSPKASAVSAEEGAAMEQVRNRTDDRV